MGWLLMEIRVALHIKPEVFRRYYDGQAVSVTAKSHDGRKLRFPANILRPFVSRDGVHGEFILQIDEKGKLLSINKLT